MGGMVFDDKSKFYIGQELYAKSSIFQFKHVNVSLCAVDVQKRRIFDSYDVDLQRIFCEGWGVFHICESVPLGDISY